MSSSIRIIKKYPNRRLYDTTTSAYITLTDVKTLVLELVEFQVVDAKTSEDLTRAILLQIILEEESGGLPMFTSDMLAKIIRFYGHAMQGMMGNYLEKNIQTFIEIQNKLQDQSRALYSGTPSLMNSDFWAQFLKFQAPAMQGMMGNYLEQSATMFTEMQQQMQKKAQGVFGGFPFPGFPIPGATEQKAEPVHETPKAASEPKKSSRKK